MFFIITDLAWNRSQGSIHYNPTNTSYMYMIMYIIYYNMDPFSCLGYAQQCNAVQCMAYCYSWMGDVDKALFVRVSF